MKEKNKAAKKDRRTFLYKLTFPLTAWIVYPFFLLKVVKGKNNIPKEGACIAAGNHIHFADPVLLYYAQKRQLRYMAKVELFKNPVLRWLCKSYGAFPVQRGAADVESIGNALKILEEGKVLGIFPEGTRSKDGSVGRGKSGTVMLAHKAGVPIYPFAVYSKRRPLKLFCKYTIAYGDPVTVEELGVTTGASGEYREATKKLMEIIAQLQDECREAR